MTRANTNGVEVRKKDSEPNFRNGGLDLKKSSVRKRLIAGAGESEADSEEVEDSGSDDSFVSEVDHGGDIDRKKAINGVDRSTGRHSHRHLAPAHSEVRESPLSSSTIFEQVFRLQFHYYSAKFPFSNI